MTRGFENLKVHVAGRVAVITYDRQERRNAWGLAMYRELVRAVEDVNEDDAVGAIVVTHYGPVFCAGTDFKDGPHDKDPKTGIRPDIATESMALDKSWLHLLARSKPIVAAITGKAIGLGVTQLLPMDIRVGGESSTYSFPFLELGFMPELGSTGLLPRMVGLGRALDLCLSAATLDVREALAIGLVSRVVPDDQVLDHAIGLADRIASFPRRQVALTRSLILSNAMESDINAILERETAAFRQLPPRERRSL